MVLVLIVRGKPLKALAKSRRGRRGRGPRLRGAEAVEDGAVGGRPRGGAGPEDRPGGGEGAHRHRGQRPAAPRAGDREAGDRVHPETRGHAPRTWRGGGGRDRPQGLRPGRRRGRRRPARPAIALAEELAARGRAPGRLVYPIVGRLREVHGVVALLDSGVAEKDLGQHIKAPPWKLKKAVALARKADRETPRARPVPVRGPRGRDRAAAARSTRTRRSRWRYARAAA